MPNPLLTNRQLGPDVARANLLTNGGFEIWQRGNGPFTANGAYAADRWQLALGGASVTITKETTTVDTGSGASAKVVITTGGAYFGQKLEDLLGLSNRTVTLSMRVWASAANAVRLYLQINGGGGANDIYSAYHPGGSVWQTLSVTASLAALTNLWAYVHLAAAATVYLDNAMLVVGAQPANYVPLHPADDLARCLRYYQQIGSGVTQDIYISGYASAGSQNQGGTLSYVQKPVTPTATKVGTWSVSNCGQPALLGAGANSLGIYAPSVGAGAMAFYSGAGMYITLESNP